MLSDDSVATIEQWWAADLGCSVEDLRGDQLLVTRQGGRSVFVLACWSTPSNEGRASPPTL